MVKNTEIDCTDCWIRIEERDDEVKVLVNPKTESGRRALPLAYILGSNALFYKKKKVKDGK